MPPFFGFTPGKKTCHQPNDSAFPPRTSQFPKELKTLHHRFRSHLGSILVSPFSYGRYFALLNAKKFIAAIVLLGSCGKLWALFFRQQVNVVLSAQQYPVQRNTASLLLRLTIRGSWWTSLFCFPTASSLCVLLLGHNAWVGPARMADETFVSGFVLSSIALPYCRIPGDEY